ncbi:MAG TPA: protein kinase [Pyrinomonadaceae bacterium]
MTLPRGTLLGRYEIRSLLGKGGMGEVYLAQDTQLRRSVAIKLLPAELIRHPERLRRFKNEAYAASSLNHPNILTVHEIGTDGDLQYIATEFVEGESLRQHITENRMELREVLDVGIQTASALAAAHQAGIVHRDIKPENIILRRDGYVKILDFGLAKLIEQQAPTTGTEVPTTPLINTDPGVVMGTAYYMSPEQARGLAVDARTDIWSIGVLLYEMVTGRRPFEGQTTSDVIAAVLKTEPPVLTSSTFNIPTELDRIVSKTLKKDREERYQAAKELALDLKSLKQRLEFEAERERTDPLRSKNDGSKPTNGLNDSANITTQLPTEQTGAGREAQTKSSAEYIAGEIKRHKGAAVLTSVVLVAALFAVSYFAYARYSQSGKVAITSLAVLPFVNASNNPDAEYLCDGISESLINNLSQLPGVKVIARSSSFKYKGKEIDTQEVARALGVEALVMGRIVQRGDTLAISIELVNARENTHLWGEEYDRKLSDLLSVQQDISREVSEKLRLRLTGEDQKRLAKRDTENADAYELYLKGRHFLNKPTEADIRKSIDYFQQAIDRDPNYASAYVGIAQAYGLLGGVLGFVSPRYTATQGKAAVMKALAIDETLDDAHATLAQFKLYYDWDWSAAEKEYKRTLELNPNNPTAHGGYGTYLEALGRFDEAAAERERSRQLDPVSAFTTADVGYPLYYARKYDEALEHFRKGIELDSNLSWAHLWIGQVYVQQARYDEAFNEINRAISLSEGNVRGIATLGHAYAVSGKRSEALKVLAQLQEQAKQKYVSAYFIALIYSGLNEKDQAFAWLEKAYEERHPYLILIKSEPVFDNLRSDPRFQALLRRVGLL